MATTEPGNTLFGVWLRHQRKSRGLTQDELGRRAMCSGYAISKIERGERRPSRQLAGVLASALSVPPEEMEAFLDFARAAFRNEHSAAWPGLAASQAPWRYSAAAQAQENLDRPNNLPAPLTPFIGREHHLRRLEERLMHKDVRLLTLVGPPGVGKTRLALELATHVTGAFEHGVFLVELAPLRDPNLVLSAIASVLGVLEKPGLPLFEILKSHIGATDTLLVIDNFEHLLESGMLLSKLLATCPGLKVLATSREPLNLYPEHRFEVPPLQLPDRAQLDLLSTQALGQYEAVKLFEERARALFFDFAVTAENARAIVEVCYQLEGLPLAIELAVASMETTHIQNMAKGVQVHLRVLSYTARDLPSRHQSLQGAIAWSYDLLSGPERQLFRSLAVFVGGCTVQSVAAVCICAQGSTDLAAQLNSFVGKSLLRKQRNSREPDGSRFSMLETISVFAQDRAEEAGELDGLKRRHALFFTALAEKGASGADDATSCDRLESDHNNLRAALAWALGPAGEAELALRLATALRGFWTIRGYLAEAQQWLSRAIEQGREAPAAVRASALYSLAAIYWRQGRSGECKAYLPEALDLFTALHDRSGIASCLALEADCALLNADNSVDSQAEGQALMEQSLSLFKEMGDTNGVALALGKLGEFARLGGRFRVAEQLYSEVMSLAEEIGWSDMVSIQLHNLGHVAAHAGDYGRAAELFVESLARARDAGHKQLAAIVLLGLAGVANARRQPLRAAVLFGAGDHLLGSAGASLNRPDQLEYNRNLASARSQLDDQTWEMFYGKGRKMRPERAIEYALEES
jgi:predicted ATPase/DNA-binding XRE family transcriptional regulator